MSWDEAFARRYDEWSAHMTEDVPFYVELAREADGPLVELAIGNGRVAIPVAQATGLDLACQRLSHFGGKTTETCARSRVTECEHDVRPNSHANSSQSRKPPDPPRKRIDRM